MTASQSYSVRIGFRTWGMLIRGFTLCEWQHVRPIDASDSDRIVWAVLNVSARWDASANTDRESRDLRNNSRNLRRKPYRGRRSGEYERKTWIPVCPGLVYQVISVPALHRCKATFLWIVKYRPFREICYIKAFAFASRVEEWKEHAHCLNTRAIMMNTNHIFSPSFISCGEKIRLRWTGDGHPPWVDITNHDGPWKRPEPTLRHNFRTPISVEHILFAAAASTSSLETSNMGEVHEIRMTR